MPKKSTEIKLYENALERLSRNQDYFLQFENIWDWIAKEEENKVDREIKYLEYLKNVIIKRYWEKETFISPSALDEIIFYCIRCYPKNEIVSRINDQIKKSHLGRNSVVIFPVNSFGFKYGGLGKILGQQAFEYQYGNFKIISQTNSFKITKANIIQYLKDIKIPNIKKLDDDLFRHYYMSRSLQWFSKNPIMLMHFKFSQQERYDNLNFIIEKINFVTNKLYFISALANTEDSTGSLFSTSNTNNWETLDIRHLLTITSSKSRLTLNCIPMHFKKFRADEMMHLNIDLLIKTKPSRWHKKAIDSVDELYNGYMKFLLTKEPKFLVYNRIANSLLYFRRSIKSLNKEDTIININIAFEILLLDNGASQKKDTMIDRLWKSLKGKINKKENLKNIIEIITERNSIIHAGLPSIVKVDFNDVNKTYCKFILFLTDSLPKIDSTCENYLSIFYNSI